MRSMNLAPNRNRQTSANRQDSRQSQQRSIAPSSVSHGNERVSHLESVIHRTQKELDDLKSRNTQLSEDVMTLTEHQKSTQRGKDSKAKEKTPHLQDAAEAGRKFACICTPWINESTVRRAESGRPEIDPLDYNQRYESEESEVLAIVAEVWDQLASHKSIQDKLGYDQEIISVFTKAVKEEKSKFTFACRSNADIIFADLGPVAISLRTVEGRRACSALRALGPVDGVDLFSSVLFPAEHVGDGAWLFRTPRLLMVIRSALFGIGSVHGTSRKSSNVKAHLWNIKEATPGLVALSATVLVYMTSGDEMFVPRDQGQSVNIEWDYPYLFESYLKMLIRTYHAPGTKALFHWINQEIFGVSMAGSGSSTSERLSQSEMRSAVRNEMLESMFGSLPTSTSTSNSLSPASAPITHSASPISRTPSHTSSAPSADSIVPAASHQNPPELDSTERSRSSFSAHPSQDLSNSSSSPQLPDEDLPSDDSSSPSQPPITKRGRRGRGAGSSRGTRAKAAHLPTSEASVAQNKSPPIAITQEPRRSGRNAPKS
ncbi:hypothetical protein BDY19DRAFT_933893 [Irpex rosettiformis]|uniref:Uncharacterized protein n=1 Tax=Irpex rosettiformis TaxID=378272 RepID=A0ACB8U9P4_9APHY|nr:hypothetical protein BDY19DRAFT_933893 [Irpex rosettiformis]